jgi:hypothetical protein
LPYVIDVPRERVVEEGRRTEVRITLRRQVRVRGVVREMVSGRPIARLDFELVHLRPDGEVEPSESLCTDPEGRYDAFAFPGQVQGRVRHTTGFTDSRTVPPIVMTIPSDVPEVELPPIEFVRTGRVRGVVVDDDGKPVGGAAVEVAWKELRRSVFFSTGSSGTTDARGAFVVGNLPTDVDLWLSAAAGEACSGPLAAIRAGEATAYTVRMSEENTRALGGRVLDELGRPVAGATITIETRSTVPTQSPPTRFVVTRKDSLRTGADGRFLSPRRLPRQNEARAHAQLPGTRGFANSGWLGPTSPSFFDITLYRIPPHDQLTIHQDYEAGSRAYNAGDYAKAEAHFRAAVAEATRRGLEDPLVPTWLDALGETLGVLDRHAEAELVFRRALVWRERVCGHEQLDIPENLGRIALACDGQDKFPEAEAFYRRALALCARLRGSDSPKYAQNLYFWGRHHFLRGQSAEALPLLAQSLAVREAALGPQYSELAFNLTLMGQCDLELKRFAAAEPLLRRASSLRESALGVRARLTAHTRQVLATLLRQTGREAEANALESRSPSGSAPG